MTKRNFWKHAAVTTATVIGMGLPTAAAAYETHGFCEFGSYVFHPQYQSAVFAWEGPLKEWSQSRDKIMADFETALRNNFNIDASYDGVRVMCHWYPIDRETTEEIEVIRGGSHKYGNYVDTDWVPGNTKVTGRKIPKR